MESSSTETVTPNAQFARLPQTLNATASSLDVSITAAMSDAYHRGRLAGITAQRAHMLELVAPYRDRVKFARNAAAAGAGWEDITVGFRIGAKLARQMVGLK